MNTTIHQGEGAAQPTFSTDPTGLEQGRTSAMVGLADGDRFDLRISPVSKLIGDHHVRMLAYDGSIPGPTLRVRQGSEITVDVHNETDADTTVHWHGLRLDNANDGVPHETQASIEAGDLFRYYVRFPDPGLYWYHPHIREDYGLEMGLYGCLLVDPVDDDYWPPVNREYVVTLDDVLIDEGRIAPFNVEGPTHVAMGRYGNVMLTSGEPMLELSAAAGDIVRLFIVNTANTRIFNVKIPGCRMKLVGADSGRYEHERFAESVLLAPSERAIVDVLFDQPGSFRLEHHTPGAVYTLGAVTVSTDPTEPSFAEQFERQRTNADMTDERRRLEVDLRRAPDKTLAFDSLMPLLYGDPTSTPESWTCPMHPEVVADGPGTCPKCGMKLVGVEGAHEHGDAAVHAHHEADGLEWEDLMPEINRRSDSSNMTWKLVDRDTGRENGDIDWAFRVGDRVKIQLQNGMDQDHPMHHPFHIHGAGRFLVLSRDGEPNDNLVWKDTVLVRSAETVDILLDVTNEGLWMAHCHIAEHNQAGMMFSFSVTRGEP